MTWRCNHPNVKTTPGRGYHCVQSLNQNEAPCQWRTQAEVSPPMGCMVSIKSLRKAVVKVSDAKNCETCALDEKGCPLDTRIRASGNWQRYSRRKVTLMTGCSIHIEKGERS